MKAIEIYEKINAIENAIGSINSVLLDDVLQNCLAETKKVLDELTEKKNRLWDAYDQCKQTERAENAARLNELLISHPDFLAPLTEVVNGFDGREASEIDVNDGDTVEVRGYEAGVPVGYTLSIETGEVVDSYNAEYDDDYDD